MAIRLIINADDFGLTTGVNRAIRELHQAGVLTSATLMATGRAFDDAVRVAHANSSLGVGCHIVLTDGIPVSPPGSIPSLLGADGKHFRPSLVDFLQALLRGTIQEREIEIEARAQVQKLRQAGIGVTHLDTHKHTHMFPVVFRPLLRVAKDCSIGGIRNPFEPRWCRSLGRAGLVRRFQLALLDHLRPQFEARSQLDNGHVLSTEGSIGVSATGDLNAASLHQILAHAPDGLWELVCHPGYNDAELATVTTRLRSHRDIERQALLSILPEFLAQPSPLQLINYGELNSSVSSAGIDTATIDTRFDLT